MQMEDSVQNEIKRHRPRDKEIMDPESKRQNLSVETTMDIKEEEQCVDDVDRISNLPPELIGKILSLLPTTKEAVATCVLSSTWKWFWTFITRLNFVADFSKPILISFINRLLRHHKPTTLDYFCIHCYIYDKNLNISHLREWVSAALLVDVKELELSIYGGGDPSNILPFELFSCKKLVKLTLGGGFKLDIPALVCLPSLEAMHLDRVIFPDDDSVQRLLGGCPSLRELQIRIDCVEVLHVDAPSLSKLSVNYTGLYGWRKMVLKTPSLRYLRVNLPADSSELIDVNQLVEAELRHICFPRRYEAIANLIKGVTNVTTLFLCGSVMQAIVKGGCEPPKFHKLTTLKLGEYYGIGWAAIPVLLEKTPFIETIVFEHGIQVSDSSSYTPWQAPQKVPYCLHHHLKVIEIKSFEGDIEGEELIRYFIENRGGLKDLTIIQYPARLGTLWANRKTVYRRRSGLEAT